MKQTGQILREAREKKGISVNEVAIATKISAKIIESIEKADLDSLPPKAFLRGFIQTYATYLKLDSKNILNTFMEEMGERDKRQSYYQVAPTQETPKTAPPTPIDTKNSKLFIQVAVAVFALVILLIVKFLFKTIERYEKDSRPPTPAEIANTIKEPAVEPVEPIADPALKPHEAPTPSTQTAAPTEPPKPAATTPPPATAKPTTTQAAAPPAPAPANTPPPTPKPAATAPAPAPTPEASADASKKALNTETGASIKNRELILEALDTVEITYSVDGGPAKRIKLDPDKIQIIKAEKTIKVDVSDAGAINVIYNGEDLGVPGSLGKPMTLNYPK